MHEENQKHNNIIIIHYYNITDDDAFNTTLTHGLERNAGNKGMMMKLKKSLQE